MLASQRRERPGDPGLAAGGIEGAVAPTRQRMQARFEDRPPADDAVLDHLDEHAVQPADDRLVVEAAVAFEFEHADEAAGLGGHGGHSRSSAAMPRAFGPV
ncbi:MAG: hypothetical protein M5U18_17780 [Dehalococcoidia bacterium]|nr:hypothetical protein [Dehalococcoidia bacterium]